MAGYQAEKRADIYVLDMTVTGERTEAWQPGQFVLSVGALLRPAVGVINCKTFIYGR